MNDAHKIGRRVACELSPTCLHDVVVRCECEDGAHAPCADAPPPANRREIRATSTPPIKPWQAGR
jgi:hypothetical protein